MNLFSIAFRSIVQRSVASVLTMLSMALGVMLVVAVLSIHGVVSQSFRNNASLGYNMIVGAKGGREQLTLNTVYYLSAPVENIPYSYYLEFLPRAERDRLLVDSFAGRAHDVATQTAELALLVEGDCGSGLAGAAIALALDAAALPELKAAEFGRDGKYGAMTELAIPLCLGDYYGRFRVVGTTPKLFDDLVFDIENERKFEFAQGRNFQHRSKENGFFEAVVGSAVARELDVNVGDRISPSHGSPEGHEHERKFTVVGILKTSGTPNDRAVFVNMEGFYLMEDHAKPIVEEKPAEPSPDGAKLTPEQETKLREEFYAKQKKGKEIEREPDPEPLPVEQREVTAVLIKTPAMIAPGLENAISEGRDAQAVLPVAVIYGLFEFIVNPVEWTLLLLTAMICVVSGISILVSIYNSMSERRHEIAVMRALGAGRGTVMWIILFESMLLSLGGGIVGWFIGHLACLIVSPWVEAQTGVIVGFFSYRPLELVLIPALIGLAVIVGLWPGISAYRTDVAKSLGK